MPLRPCLGCGRPTTGNRCGGPGDGCTKPTPPKPLLSQRRPDYTWAERQRRTAAVQAHRQQHGEWCPGWAGRTPHPVTPPNILTADHHQPVGAGGAESGPLVVRCRKCNSTKGARTT